MLDEKDGGLTYNTSQGRQSILLETLVVADLQWKAAVDDRVDHLVLVILQAVFACCDTEQIWPQIPVVQEIE